MGKKSLTKSTSKKKTTKKKSTTKTTSKKTVSADSKAKKSTSKKTTAKKKPTLKALRKKDFGTWAPETRYAPEPQIGEFTAPPVIDTDDKKTADNLKALLTKQFELGEKKKAAPKKTQKKKAPATATQKKPAPKKTQKKAAPKKKTVSAEELIKKQFDTWQPDKLFTPEADKNAAPQFSAPAFADDVDADKLKELLSREFDLSKVTPKPPPEPEKARAPEAAKAEEKPAAEAPKAEEKKEEKKAAETPKAEKPSKPAKGAAKAEEPKKPSPPPSGGGGGGGEPPATPPPSGPQEPAEPVSNALKIAVICIAALFACLILASALNSSKYYIKATDKGTEIWKGDFSPRGKEKVISLKGVTPPEDTSSSPVSKQNAYTLPFNYFMTRAEKLSEKSGIPDFAAIREELKKARKYAVSQAQIKRVNDRLNHIEFTFLLYKADMAAEQATAEGDDKALKYLKEARELAASDSQAERVEKRILEITGAGSGSEKSETQPNTPSDKPECPCPATGGEAESEEPQSTDKEEAEQTPSKPETKPGEASDENHVM